jgi:hypothetical protein
MKGREYRARFPYAADHDALYGLIAETAVRRLADQLRFGSDVSP